MRLLVTLVLVALASHSSGHWVVPVVANGQLASPYHYVVHHTSAGVAPSYDVHNAVSRETLEEQSGEGFLQQTPDISDEQATLDPDDTQSHQVPQVPQRPQVPSLPPRPRPGQRPVPQPGPEPAPGNTNPGNVVFNGPQPDGSYDFSYSIGDQSRSEKSDANGNVQGVYSYTGPDGKEVKVTYTAGADQGYIPEGEGLLPPPPAHGEDDWEGDSAQGPAHPSRPQVPQIPTRPRPSVPRPAPRPVPQPGSRPAPQPGSEPAPANTDPGNVVFNGPQQDGSYDFSYNIGDQSRSEKSDANGNVQGVYSYTGSDGKEVKVTYTAGADQGYIPEGEGLLPPPPASPQGEGDDQGEGDSNQGPAHPGNPQAPQDPDDDNQQHITPVVPPKRPGTKTPVKRPGTKTPVPKTPDSGDEGGSHGGMPYSYNYDAELSSKTETADDNGNVEGSYTYVDGAGIKRTVTYTVKGDEGFVASGDIHPDPGTPDEGPARPTGARPPVTSAPPVHKGGRADDGGRKAPNPRQPATPPPTRKGGHPTKGGRGGSGWDKYPLGG